MLLSSSALRVAHFVSFSPAAAGGIEHERGPFTVPLAMAPNDSTQAKHCGPEKYERLTRREIFDAEGNDVSDGPCGVVHY